MPKCGSTPFVLLIVIALLASAGGGAVAARLMGSRDIADNSLKSVDVKNGTLRGKDVQDGALTAADFSGPPPAGARSNATYEWTATFTATGDPSTGSDPLVTSADALPASAHLQGLDIDVTGDFSRCVAGADLSVKPVRAGAWGTGGGLAGASFWGGQSGPRQLQVGEVQSRPDGTTRLGVHAVCWDADSDEVAVPSFTLTVRFTLTKLTAPRAIELN